MAEKLIRSLDSGNATAGATCASLAQNGPGESHVIHQEADTEQGYSPAVLDDSGNFNAQLYDAPTLYKVILIFIFICSIFHCSSISFSLYQDD